MSENVGKTWEHVKSLRRGNLAVFGRFIVSTVDHIVPTNGDRGLIHSPMFPHIVYHPHYNHVSTSFVHQFCSFFRVREFRFLLGKICVAHSVAHSFIFLLCCALSVKDGIPPAGPRRYSKYRRSSLHKSPQWDVR